MNGTVGCPGAHQRKFVACFPQSDVDNITGNRSLMTYPRFGFKVKIGITFWLVLKIDLSVAVLNESAQ